MVVAVLGLGACTASEGPLGKYAGKGPRGLRVAEAALVGGLPQAALNATRGVLEQDPKNVPALLQQGEALATLNRAEAAAESYRRVLAPDASSSREQVLQARRGLGRVELAAGHGEPAEAVFRTIIATRPGDAGARSGLGIALDLQGRHREAQAEYRAALATAEVDGIRVNLGLSLAMAGDASEAVSVLAPLARDPASSPRIRHNLAFALAIAGDRPAAERILQPDMTREQLVATLSGFDAFRSIQK